MKKISIIALFLLFISLLPMQKSFALSCAPIPAPEVAIHNYDVVLIATVTETDENSPYKTVKTLKADVSHVFKGYNDSTITFTEDKFWGESQVGKEYLLFLNHKGNGYELPLCSPNKVIGSFDLESLSKKLTEEVTKTETKVTTPPVNESGISVESESGFNWNWIFSISTPFLILLLAALILITKRNRKRIDGK